MVDGRLLKVPNVIVDDTQVDVSQEFTCNVCDLLVFHVELDSIIIEDGVNISQFHVIHAHTVVCKGFSMDIANSLAHLQELLVLRDGLLVLS